MSQEDTKRRIISDYQNLMENDELLQNSGIFYQFDDENLYHMTAMLIGPEKTPYHGGFYFFDITFPPEYPNLPPKFVYHTNYRNIRFNPNLYVNGNVCLSLLNTWSGAGEGWTPSNNIMAVFISIQGMVLNEYPLINEPGHENVSYDHKDYNKVLTHENFYTAVCRMMEHTPAGFQNYTIIMKKHFLKNIKMYLNTVSELSTQYKTTKIFSCGYCSNKVNNEYDSIYKKMLSLAAKYSKELDIPIDLPDTNSINDNTTSAVSSSATTSATSSAAPSVITMAASLTTTSATTSATTSEGYPGQCLGKKVSGVRCNYAGVFDGYCKIHIKQKV